MRRPATYWVVAAALAVITAVGVNQLTAEARRLRAAYGATVDVTVVVEATGVGTPLRSVTALRPVPTGLVPDQAVTDLADDATAAVPLTAGTIVTRPHVAADAAIGADEAALAFPVGPATPPLAVGSSVTIVAASDPFAPSPTALIGGRVVDIGADQVLVAVHRTDLEAASSAITSGTATLALAGQ